MNITTAIDESYLTEHRCRIGRQIKNIREKKGFSQEQLAEKMEVSRTTISKIESGKINCSIDYLYKFSWFLGFDFNISENKTK